MISLNLAYDRENYFSVMLSIYKVRRVKDMVDICICKNTEVSPNFSKFSFDPSRYLVKIKVSIYLNCNTNLASDANLASDTKKGRMIFGGYFVKLYQIKYLFCLKKG